MEMIDLTVGRITLAAVALTTTFAAGMLTMHVWLWYRITKWRG